MSSSSLDIWQTSEAIFTEPGHLMNISIAVLTTLSTYICLEAVWRRCQDIQRLAFHAPKYWPYRDFRYLNTSIYVQNTFIRSRNGELRNYEHHVDINMLEARFLALYTPCLSIFPLILTGAYGVYIVSVAFSETSVAPGIAVLMVQLLSYFIQGIICNASLRRYFTTVRRCRASFDFHPDIRSSRTELRESSGLGYLHLRILFTIFPMDKPSRNTQAKSDPETTPLLPGPSDEPDRRIRRPRGRTLTRYQSEIMLARALDARRQTAPRKSLDPATDMV